MTFVTVLTVAIGMPRLSPAADKTIEIKFASAVPGKTPAAQAMNRLSDQVKERTNGRVIIQVFTDSQLGNERDVAESVQMGAIQMCLNSAGSLAIFLPDLNIFSAPYIWKDENHLLKVVRGEIGNQLSKKLRTGKGIRILDAASIWGVRHVTTKGIPVMTPADLKDVKVRAPEIPIFVDMVKEWGASPVTVQSGDIFMALQTGLAKGQENPLNAIRYWRFYEVQDHLILTGHMIQNNPIVINERFFESLSAEDQKILVEETQAAVDWNNDVIQKADAEALEFLKQNGMKVIKPNVEAFRKAALPVHQKYMSTWGQELYDAIGAAASK
jgi:tripartite ATP-independent transporter DctP family solute receptor